MSQRQQALLRKFSSKLFSRLDRMGAAITASEKQALGEGGQRELLHELHTFKGDTRMLGLEAIADVIHGIETALTSHTGLDYQRVLRAFDVIARLITESAEHDTPNVSLLAELEALAFGTGSVAPTSNTATNSSDASLIQETPGRDPAPDDMSRWISVSADRVDAMSEDLEEFAWQFRSLYHQFRSEPGLRSDRQRELLEVFDQCRARLDGLADGMWTLRLTPVEPLLQEFARHARDLARDQKKQLRTVVDSAGAQLERSIVEALREPLLHLVRNAVDHGLEGSTDAVLTLKAETVGANVMLSVSDNGHGIDLERVRTIAVERGILSAEQSAASNDRDVLDIIFRTGFSTRREVGAISGRGIGLDVVRAIVERHNGTVRVTSTLGKGTTFILEMPVTIGKEQALVIKLGGGALFALPARQVREIVRIRPEANTVSVEDSMLRDEQLWSGEPLPIQALAALLGKASSRDKTALIVDAGDRLAALSVPELVGEFELVLRPVDALLQSTGYISRAAMLDDGRLVLLLTVGDLLRRSAISARIEANEDPIHARETENSHRR